MVVMLRNSTREYLKNLLWLRSYFGNRNPEQVAMVSIRNLVAIQGCDPNRNPDHNPDRNPVRNPETFWNGGFDQGCDQGCDHNPESQP